MASRERNVSASCRVLARVAAALIMMALFTNIATSASPTAPPDAGADPADERPFAGCFLEPHHYGVGGIAGVHQTNLWPEGKVYYTFHANVTEANKQRVFDAMNELEGECGVTFHIPIAHPNYVVFTDHPSENNSFVGMIGGPQTINISNWDEHYIIIHEIMHAMGAKHEHQRPDRDDYVTINWDAVPGALASNWTILVAGPQNATCLAMNGPYDFDSVMHYGACDGSTCKSCSDDDPRCTPIIVNEPYYDMWQQNIGQVDHLSDGDRDLLNLLYPVGESAPVTYETVRHTANDAQPAQTFGRSVGMAGNRVIVGAPMMDPLSDDDAAYLYSIQNGQPSIMLKLSPLDLGQGSRYGDSAAIDASQGIVGATPHGQIFFGDLGAAYVYDATSGVQQHKLTASDAEYGKIFGHAVAIDRGRAIVGSPFAVFDVVPFNDWGAAYVFDTQTGQQAAKLLPSDTLDEFIGFGMAVDIFGEASVSLAIVGAPQDGSGSAYLYDANTGDELFKFTPPNPAQSFEFGASVALNDYYAVIGAPFDNENGFGSGAVFVWSMTKMVPPVKLTPVDAESSQQFGRSVDLRGHILAVGAPWAGPAKEGGAYLFDLQTSQQLYKLQPCEAGAGDFAGFSMALSPYGVLAGAPNNNSAGALAGAVFYFESSPEASESPGCSLADFDGSGAVSTSDLLALLVNWGTCVYPAACPHDLTGDGITGTDDLLALLASWGNCL